ncbi:MAG: transcription antitermination factor NusB [Bacillota bacterium]|nr:transcription antitermination factor NusB [Bacillota bacterium]
MNRKLTREELMKLFYEMDMNEDFTIERANKYLSSIENLKIDIKYFKNNSKNFIENYKEIDNLINQYSSDWKINRIAKIDIAIMRLAITEMRYDEGIPVSVSINEAIELCKKYSSEDSHKFINGILGNINRGIKL